MVLKRKRSDAELCSSPLSSSSSSVSFSSPPHRGSFVNPLFSTSTGIGIPNNPFGPRAPPSTHLHSRTFKRHRDNRPSENLVHQRTLGLLYSAQQPSHIFQEPQRSTQLQPGSASTASTASLGQQQSLHRFWNINAAPTPAAPLSTSSPNTPSDCEDCGATLGRVGIDEMDVDGGMCPDSDACGACGKYVCFSCSVSNLGESKRCLQCAGNVSMGGTSRTNVNVAAY